MKAKVQLKQGKEKVQLTGKIAIIRLRGLTGVRHDIRKSMELLRLYRRHNCVVVEANPGNLGMIKKIKDYVTYGEIDDETYKLLVDKRGKEFKGREESSRGKIKYKKFVTVNGKKIKPFFRLSPPRKGLKRKGLRASFKRGGALGYRGKEIIKLIERMV